MCAGRPPRPGKQFGWSLQSMEMRSRAAAKTIAARLARNAPWASVAMIADTCGTSPTVVRNKLRNSASRGICDDSVIRSMSSTPKALRVKLLTSRWCPPSMQRSSAQDIATGVAGWATRSTNSPIPTRAAVAVVAARTNRVALLKAADCAHSPYAILSRLSGDTEKSIRARVAANEACPETIQDRLSRDPVPAVRSTLAANAACGPVIHERLSRDKSPTVASSSCHQPELRSGDL